jgi:hypothetical protein
VAANIASDGEKGRGRMGRDIEVLSSLKLWRDTLPKGSKFRGF